MPDIIARINYDDTDDTDFLMRLNAYAVETWKTANVLWDGGRILVKTLAKGQWSDKFKFRGQSSEEPEHHTAGQETTGGTVTNDSVTCDVDRPIVKQLNADEADLDLAYWDELQPLVRECVRHVARRLDLRAYRLAILAARQAAVSNVHNGGNRVERAVSGGVLATAYPTSSTGAANFLADMASLARLWDEDDIPENGRELHITPYMREVLTYSTVQMNRDYTDPMVARYADRFVGRAQGWNLVLTNNLPSTNITTDLSKYNGNFAVGGATGQSLPVAVGMYRADQVAPIVAVQKSPITVDIWKDMDTMAVKVRAKWHGGLAKYCPWVAGEIGTIAP